MHWPKLGNGESVPRNTTKVAVYSGQVKNKIKERDGIVIA